MFLGKKIIVMKFHYLVRSVSLQEEHFPTLPGDINMKNVLFAFKVDCLDACITVVSFEDTGSPFRNVFSGCTMYIVK